MASGASLRVRVARKWTTSEDIAAFRLETIGAPLPAFTPGAHIDVHVPTGEVRQYSLTNGPELTDAYVIGVKRDAASRGGSRAMHDTVHVGDVLAISAPRNQFPLAATRGFSLLVAGGIGITPLLAMAQHLERAENPWHLHYFARAQAHLAFPETLGMLPSARLTTHLGLDGAATGRRLNELAAARAADGHLYVCGPAPMIDATLSYAAAAGWPEERLHSERFINVPAPDDGGEQAIELHLARSGLTLLVPPGRSIIEAVRAAGVEIETSCEQGLCGTCFTRVIEGVPEHRDVFLTKAERASGTCMLPCISRATSRRLVLDL